MIMPLVILAVISVLWLLTVFYSQTALRSGVHLALRSAAGLVSDTVREGDSEAFSPGLYASILEKEQAIRLLETEAERLIRKDKGVRKGLRLEGDYDGIRIPAVFKLHFERSYGKVGLRDKNIEADHSCWYFAIDEAQWIRNEDWLRRGLKWETREE